MRNGRAGTYATFAALAVTLGLLGLVLVQLEGVEQRLVVQGQQLRALGEATDRLLAQGSRAVTTGDAPVAEHAEPQPRHVLHPEVPNFLKPRDKHWPAPGAPMGGTLVRGWPTGDPKGFNSLIENAGELGELIETFVASPIADRNAWTNPDDWHGDLASRIEITDDYKELTIYLREGVKWHPAANLDLDNPKYAWLRGEHEVTADDLVFTLDMMMNPQVENGFIKSYYKELESWKAQDAHTFVVRWKKKLYGNVDSTIGLAPLPRFIFAFNEDGTPIPKETLGLRFNQHWYNNKGYVGSGPYRMASYEPGSRIRLVRNEGFYGDKPAIAELVYPIYTDPNQTLLKLKAHELSAGALTPGQYREEILQYEQGKPKPSGSPFFDGRVQCRTLDQPVYRYLGWNADRPLFSDKRVRRAMTMALDRQQIIDSVFVGLGQVINGPYLPSTPYYDASIPLIPFDLAGARKLLEEAGWRDTDGDGLVDKELHPGDGKRTPFEFSMLLYGSSKEYAALANIFKEDLLKIGVKMNIDAAEWSLMQKRMEEKSFDAYTGAWGTGWDSDLQQIWHSSQADVPKGSNRVGFRNKEADRVIETMQTTFDPAARVRLAHQFDHIVDDEQPYTFFFAAKGVYCWWSDVKNVEFAKVRPVVNTLPWSVARGAG